MAFELYGLLAGSVKPAYACKEAFLKSVVTPLYNVIAEVRYDGYIMDKSEACYARSLA